MIDLTALSLIPLILSSATAVLVPYFFLGMKAIYFVPAGRSTEVNISSPWPDPSFTGSSLPNHKTTPDGFSAKWQSMDLKRGFPQSWSDSEYYNEIANSAFGVDLIIPVDIYQKSERSVKYALLFIGLTFLVIFFIEMISKQKIHPVQYLLTGAALIVFYSLLLALSEHLPFTLAYLISSMGIITLIVSYSNSIFSERRYTLISAIVLVVLYSFLFVILQISDMALLVGNIGLFIAIALVMFFSRKIDWYHKTE
jgi:inner membrane protein